jgi:signal transduction histidine kinase
MVAVMRRWSRPSLVVAGLLLALTYLLMQGAPPDVALHQRTLGALNAIAFHDAALQRDVLKARASLLRNYDPLVDAMEGLRATTSSLLDVARAMGGAAGADIGRRQGHLAAAVATQEELVEAFKSQNALLQNSLSYFRLVSQRLGAHGGDGERDAVAVEVASLANAMLSFMGDPTQGSAAALTASLDRLAGWPTLPSLQDDLRGLVPHGRLIVVLLPAVDAVLGRLLATSTSAEARSLRDAYLGHHGRAEARAKLFRVLLYLTSLLLLGYLIHLFFRLRANARALEARLRFERLVGGISARFIDLPRGRVDDAVGQGLARLAEHLGVDRVYILWRGDGEVLGERVFRWQRDGIPEPLDRVDDALAIATRWSLEGYERHGCIQVPRAAALPASPERAFLEERGARSWLCVPLWRAGDRVGLLGFETMREERRWLADDLTLLRTAAEIFASALERARAAAERETLEARLRQAQRMEAIGTLAGGIAHDFNNILGAILGHAEMALLALPSRGRPAGHVRQVMKAGERAKGVVDQILAFSRRGERPRRPVRVQAVVEEAVDLLRASLPATITLRLRLEAEEAVVRGNPSQLQQVVVNLCTNAAQAMDGRGVLEIALGTVALARGATLSHGTLPAGRYVRLTVRDTGHGMDPATMERAFEPFFTTKAAGGGTGLGLATTHGIVADHGGALNVHSRPGKGSTFEAHFAQADVASAVDEEDPEAPVARGRGEVVLLVDDEQTLVLLGEEMLAALGYEPVGFDSAAKALAAFRADPGRFDLVLTDEVMPEMTGTELAQSLHEIRPELPILLMTGHGDPVQPHRLRVAGVREILKKPLLSRAIAEGLARQLRPSA